MNSCIKGSVALTKVALKAINVKQDLKISEGILATLYEQQWEPSCFPFELAVDCPTPFRMWTDCVQNFTCQNSQ